MKCPKCENEVEESASFCPKCGKDLTVEKFFGNKNENSPKNDASVKQNTSQSTPNSQTPIQQYPNSPYYPTQPPVYPPQQPTNQQPYQQHPYPYYPPQPAPIPEKNGMAIAGFVCSFFVPILGWVFGGIGLSDAKKRNGKGKGFSIAAIVISTVMFFVYGAGY